MKIKLLCVGKTSKSFLLEGENEYLKRLSKYTSVLKIEVPDIKNSKGRSESQIKNEEAKALQKNIKSNDFVILLDEKGTSYSSIDFAKFLQEKLISVSGSLVFVVGGPYGFSEELYDRKNGIISFSKMTLSHQMIRVFFCEQLYRAFTILNGEPYHNS